MTKKILMALAIFLLCQDPLWAQTSDPDALWETYLAEDKALVEAWTATPEQERTRVAELLHRTERDQEIRKVLLNIVQVYNGNLGQAGPLGLQLVQRLQQIDAENLAWMKQQIDTHGWFTISEHGKIAANRAFLIVQHATSDIPFMEKMLALFEQLAPMGEVAADDYALLYDRVTLNTKGVQRYGSQVKCEGGKIILDAPLENADNVDTLRADVGLPPLEEYKDLVARTTGCST